VKQYRSASEIIKITLASLMSKVAVNGVKSGAADVATQFSKFCRKAYVSARTPENAQILCTAFLREYSAIAAGDWNIVNKLVTLSTTMRNNESIGSKGHVSELVNLVGEELAQEIDAMYDFPQVPDIEDFPEDAAEG